MRPAHGSISSSPTTERNAKKAQKARGYVTVKRSGEGDAIKIPKGHVFKTETDINGEELRFFVTENTVLQKGASSVDVIVEAEKEGSRYNVPPGQISKTLVYLGELDSISNGEDWIIREGSDTEDDESFRGRGTPVVGRAVSAGYRGQLHQCGGECRGRTVRTS